MPLGLGVALIGIYELAYLLLLIEYAAYGFYVVYEKDPPTVYND